MNKLKFIEEFSFFSFHNTLFAMRVFASFSIFLYDSLCSVRWIFFLSIRWNSLKFVKTFNNNQIPFRFTRFSTRFNRICFIRLKCLSVSEKEWKYFYDEELNDTVKRTSYQWQAQWKTTRQTSASLLKWWKETESAVVRELKKKINIFILLWCGYEVFVNGLNENDDELLVLFMNWNFRFGFESILCAPLFSSIPFEWNEPQPARVNYIGEKEFYGWQPYQRWRRSM